MTFGALCLLRSRLPLLCLMRCISLCLAPLPNAPHIKEMTILVIFNNLPPLPLQLSIGGGEGGGFSLSLFFTLGNFCCPPSSLLLFLLSSNRNGGNGQDPKHHSGRIPSHKHHFRMIFVWNLGWRLWKSEQIFWFLSQANVDQN